MWMMVQALGHRVMTGKIPWMLWLAAGGYVAGVIALRRPRTRSALLRPWRSFGIGALAVGLAGTVWAAWTLLRWWPRPAAPRRLEGFWVLVTLAASAHAQWAARRDPAVLTFALARVTTRAFETWMHRMDRVFPGAIPPFAVPRAVRRQSAVPPQS